MDKLYVKEYNKAVRKMINSESRTIAKAIESIEKSEKIKENIAKNTSSKPKW